MHSRRPHADRRFAHPQHRHDDSPFGSGRQGRGGRSGLGRFFAHGDLRLLVLHLSTGDGAKKLHSITAEGRSYLEAYHPAVDALLARMNEASRTHGGGPAPQILRAMENLKLALRLRLARGPLSEEQINAVAAVIDNAAIGVERTCFP